MAGGLNPIGNLLGKVDANGALLVALSGSFSGQLLGAVSATVPAYSFAGDPNTGYGSTTADTLGLFAGTTTPQVTLTASAFTSTVQTTVSGVNGGGSNAAFLAQNAGQAGYGWRDSTGAADGKNWDAIVVGPIQHFRVLNDAVSGSTNWLTVTRSGTSVSSVNLQATSVQANGVPVAGAVAAGYKVARGSTALDGGNPTTIATGLSTVVSFAATLVRNSALTSGTAFVTHDTPSGANVDVYGWVLAGTASTGTEMVDWVAVGT